MKKKSSSTKGRIQVGESGYPEFHDMFVPKGIFFTNGVGVHKDRLSSFELALRDASVEKKLESDEATAVANAFGYARARETALPSGIASSNRPLPASGAAIRIARRIAQSVA